MQQSLGQRSRALCCPCVQSSTEVIETVSLPETGENRWPPFFSSGRPCRSSKLQTDPRCALCGKAQGLKPQAGHNSQSDTLLHHTILCDATPYRAGLDSTIPHSSTLYYSILYPEPRFAGVWIASIPSHLLPVRRSWKVVASRLFFKHVVQVLVQFYVFV